MTKRLQSVILSNLSCPDGSAIYSFGNTVIQSSVYGPGEVNQTKEKVEKATVEVIFKKRVRPANKESPDVKFIEEFIRSNLEAIMYVNSYPRSLVTIIIHELQDDGSLLPSCLNAACCALLDSGFPLKHLLASVLVVIDNNDKIIVNPNLDELIDYKASFIITFDSTNNNILSVTSSGSFNYSQFQQCLNTCKESSKDIFNMYRDAAQKRFVSKSVS